MKKIAEITSKKQEEKGFTLSNLSIHYCRTVTVNEAFSKISKKNKSLFFLDIQPHESKSLNTNYYYKHQVYNSIFFSSHTSYNINFQQKYTSNYRLVPIQTKMVEVSKFVKHSPLTTNVSQLKSHANIRRFKKIAVYIDNNMVLIPLDNIFYFEAKGSYTIIHHKEGQDMTVKKINHFETLLALDSRFFRVHRSYYVNITVIKKYSKKQGLSIVLDNKKTIPVSKYKKETLEQLMQMDTIF